MEHLDEESPEVQFALFGSADLWRGGTVVLGLSLWAQVFWYPFAAEFASGRATPLYVGVYLLPTLVLFVATFLAESGGFLFFVPVSFIPGLVLLPQQDVNALLEPQRAVTAAGTLLAVLFAGALASRSSTEWKGGERSLDEETRSLEGLYPYYFGLRFGIALVLFGVLVGAVVFDPSLTRALAEHHTEGRVAAQTFLLVFGFFTWCVLAYTTFLMPAANLEYDVRRLARGIDALASDPSAIRWRLGVTVALGVAFVGLLTLWELM